MTEVTPHPDCPFTAKTFELLENFNSSTVRVSSTDFYLAHKNEFKEYVEQPFQKIYNYLWAQLQGEIIKKLNIKLNKLPRMNGYEFRYDLYNSISITNNDNAISDDAMLFIIFNGYELSFGLYITANSHDKSRFVRNIKNQKIKEIILQNTNTNILDYSCFHHSSNSNIEKINFLLDWLKIIYRQNSTTKNIEVRRHLHWKEVIRHSTEELVFKIKETLESVYILFLVATFDKPIRHIQEYLYPEVDPVNRSIFHSKEGLKYNQQDKYEEAIKRYDLALDITPNFAMAYKLRAKAKEKLGDRDGAISDFRQLLLIQPKNAEIYNALGDLYLQCEYHLQACENYSQAILIKSDYALAYYNRALSYLRSGSRRIIAERLALGIYDKQIAINDLLTAINLFEQEKNMKNQTKAQHLLNTIYPDYSEPDFPVIYQNICSQNLQISEHILRRYHLALKTRKFVILSGISGTGKTWLTKAYAQAIEAEYLLVPVAPNWTTNEDLLGYFNPIDKEYYHTAFSHFLEKAAEEYERAKIYKHTPIPYHLVLDEMNLARVEYYFAKFLSAMEVRMREGETEIELAPGKTILLPPNLYFIGTVNVDETTHGFADKIYDRAQMIELEINRGDLEKYLDDVDYRDILMQIWDNLHEVAPFAFRTLEEIKTYVKEAEVLGIYQNDALDEQLLQKIIPKLKGADDRVGNALQSLIEIAENNEFNLSLAKAKKMLNTFEQYGFTSYF